MKLTELKIVDIKNSKSQNETFALVLGERDGDRTFPIFIGLSEARAIAMQLNKIQQLRPSTHDLLFNFSRQCGCKILRVVIVNYKEGIYYSIVYVETPEKKTFELDARTSDAVTLALKADVPIYIDDVLLEKMTGNAYENPSRTPLFEVEEQEFDSEENVDNESENLRDDDEYVIQHLQTVSDDELHRLLTGAVECEDFELASKIQEEIERRNH